MSIVPNNIHIILKTNIPNFYRVSYVPSMTYISSGSSSVYFNPLIKYKQNAITNNMQFFNYNEFENFMTRLINDGVKKYTLQQSIQKNIIDNNIQLTINNIFQNNGVLYLDNKPYTIIDKSFEWKLVKIKTKTDETKTKTDEIKTKTIEIKKIYVIVNLILYPGTNMNSKEQSYMKCYVNYEKIRKSYAKLMGYEYRPQLLEKKGGRSKSKRKTKKKMI